MTHSTPDEDQSEYERSRDLVRDLVDDTADSSAKNYADKVAELRDAASNLCDDADRAIADLADQLDANTAAAGNQPGDTPTSDVTTPATPDPVTTDTVALPAESTDFGVQAGNPLQADPPGSNPNQPADEGDAAAQDQAATGQQDATPTAGSDQTGEPTGNAPASSSQGVA